MRYTSTLTTVSVLFKFFVRSCSYSFPKIMNKYKFREKLITLAGEVVISGASEISTINNNHKMTTIHSYRLEICTEKLPRLVRPSE